MAAKNLGSLGGELQRRTALSLLAGAGASVGLAACATESGTPVETSTPSGTATESSQPPGGRKLLGATADVPIASGARFKVNDLEILVTQPTEGDFKAFDATCTHAGCIVTGVMERQIACACHGARFDMSTGAVLAGPAKAALGKVPIVVEGDQIFAEL